MKLQTALRSFLAFAAFLNSVSINPLSASDHDDGELSLKGRALNLTDVYVFREDWQDPSAGSENLILVMNTNPRSVARQQYFFDSKATYRFNLTRVRDADKAKKPTGQRDITLFVQFGAPNEKGNQEIYLSMVSAGRLLADRVAAGSTTTLADVAANSVLPGSARIGNQTIGVFAGLREDSFFFDVERYFRIRSFLAGGPNTLGEGPTQGGGNPFRSDATAVDFTTGYNVNSIVLRVPLALLRANRQQNVFDVWETISVPTLSLTNTTFSNFRPLTRFLDRLARLFSGFLFNAPIQQIERLGRPAINEGLVLSNDKLNAYNSIGPAKDLSDDAKPVIAEAGAVLTAVYNYGKSLGLPAPEVANVVAGFLPDVMRIDTRNTVPVSSAAYNSDKIDVDGVNGQTMLTGGRKIEDDVMDITLSYLIAGDASGVVIKDGVSYAGGTDCTRAGKGTNIANPGHKCLEGQTQRLGAARFPFLATPH